jgi:membrane dipeptidase
VNGPFVASHSNVREVTRHPRNLTDDMIRKLAEHGGVAGLNFCGDFVENYLGELYSPREKLGCTIEDLVRHAKHLANVGGVDCVALGSDFDGIGYAPAEMTDCTKMENLISALEQGGFRGESLEKICWKNAYRVICDVCRNPV